MFRARRQGKFDVLQACNPPDIFWPIARWLRRRDGIAVRLRPPRPLPRALRLALSGRQRAAKARAARAGAGDLPYGRSRRVDQRLLCRDRDAPRRQGADRRHGGAYRSRSRSACSRKAAVPALRRGRKHLVAYIGVMGPQDGVDLAVRAAAHVVHDLGREDVAFTFMGAGDSYDDIVALRDELGLQDYVELPGRVPDETVVDVLSTAAVGLSPDPKNPLNDVSTMNKTMEYMAFGLPVVAFDLKETRVSAGEAASYRPSGDVAAYAKAIVELLDDAGAARGHGPARAPPDRGRAGLAATNASAYVGVYDKLVRPSTGCEADMCGVAGAFLPAGRELGWYRR